MVSQGSRRADMESVLRTVIARLRSEGLENEAEVRLAVIEPLLRTLNWDAVADPGSIKPEYSAGRGRVDYALMWRGRPQVFIEAKRRGGLDVRAEEQLFSYASNNGIPLLVLTDGYYWDFYLSMADGLPEQRRFHCMELDRETEIPEYIKFLRSHLDKHRVASGEARRSAEACLEKGREREMARKAIPTAWKALLHEPDELLRDLLAEKVQDATGVKPHHVDVDEFLLGLSSVLMDSTAARRPSIQGQNHSKRQGSTLLNKDPSVSKSGTGDNWRSRAAAGSSPRFSQNKARAKEGFQDIVYDLMQMLLETYPNVLDKKTICYLENTTHPMGTKLSYSLIREISKGREINGHARYKKDMYAGQWYVCTEWNKTYHLYNAVKLIEWVNSLIAETENFKAREALSVIVDRLDAFAQRSQT